MGSFRYEEDLQSSGTVSAGVDKSASSAAGSVAFLLLVMTSNLESKSLKAEQGGNLQFAEYHGNLQKNALTTYKKKKSGIEKVRNKFQNSPRGF